MLAARTVARAGGVDAVSRSRATEFQFRLCLVVAFYDVGRVAVDHDHRP
jgi:hypothetical protein